jgi:hypothetical protein
VAGRKEVVLEGVRRRALVVRNSILMDGPESVESTAEVRDGERKKVDVERAV